MQKGEGLECFKLKYLSDGLQVVGYLVKPKTVSSKLPVVIYNRGGHREFGRITLGTILELASFAEAGFVVLASEYRGNAGGEGKDEAGGADVNDVLNLVPLAESLAAKQLSGQCGALDSNCQWAHSQRSKTSSHNEHPSNKPKPVRISSAS